MAFIQSLDDSILMFIQNNIRCEILDTIMPIITVLGSGWGAWIIIMIIMLLSKKYHKYGVVLGMTELFNFILSEQIIKRIVERARPCQVNQAIEMLVAIPKSYSFPSGHSSSSFAVAVILYKVNKTWGRVAIVFAAIVAFSRMYLYVHYPSDVLCGAAIGITVALTTYKVFLQKKYIKSEEGFQEKM